MKSKLLLCAIALALSMTNASSYARPFQTEHLKSNQIQEDGAILAWLIVLDKNEIAAAKEATDRELNPAVKKYTQLIKRQHSDNLKQTLRVSRKINENPIKTDVAVKLQQVGKQQLSELKAMDDQAFQKQYIEMMISTHRAALDKINEDYLKNVHSDFLKDHLKTTRQQIQSHLEKAKNLREQLNTDA